MVTLIIIIWYTGYFPLLEILLFLIIMRTKYRQIVPYRERFVCTSYELFPIGNSPQTVPYR
jgi:hypothetical protein